MSSEPVKRAFESLGPIDYADLPDDEQLPDFLRSLFQQAELVLNSFPSIYSEDAIKPDALAGPNTATTANDTLLEPSTIPKSYDPRQSTSDLQKPWGKPIKVSPKDNPLAVSIWKQAAHDRHGAWFARRSVHQGIGFERWKRCMQREFLTSFKVKGGPGAGAVRGIAADRRLEQKTVPDLAGAEGIYLLFVLSKVPSELIVAHSLATILRLSRTHHVSRVHHPHDHI